MPLAHTLHGKSRKCVDGSQSYVSDSCFSILGEEWLI